MLTTKELTGRGGRLRAKSSGKDQFGLYRRIVCDMKASTVSVSLCSNAHTRYIHAQCTSIVFKPQRSLTIAQTCTESLCAYKGRGLVIDTLGTPQ